MLKLWRLFSQRYGPSLSIVVNCTPLAVGTGCAEEGQHTILAGEALADAVPFPGRPPQWIDRDAGQEAVHEDGEDGVFCILWGDFFHTSLEENEVPPLCNLTAEGRGRVERIMGKSRIARPRRSFGTLYVHTHTHTYLLQAKLLGTFKAVEDPLGIEVSGVLGYISIGFLAQ